MSLPSPTRPSSGSPGKRSPGKTSPGKSRETSTTAFTSAPSSPQPSPPKPGVVGPRQWEPSLTIKCRLCGGPRCRRCSESAALLKTNSPVTGLHADWATESMLGMMRPSTRLMQTYRVAEQFQRLRIKAVFNLTIPGEHPHCGDGLVASGFPYDPETDLMAHNIQFYNFAWEDMTTPALPFMVDLAKVMTGVLSHANQKVKCRKQWNVLNKNGIHTAGRPLPRRVWPDRARDRLHPGVPARHFTTKRTTRKNEDCAIDIVRRGRPGSIQTSGQVEFVRHFYDYVHGARLVFAMPSIHERFTLQDMMEREQRQYTHHKRSPNGVVPPKVVSFLCQALEAAADASPSPRQLCMIFVTHLPSSCSDGSASSHYEHLKHVLGDAHDLPLGQAMVVAADELWPHKVRMNTGELSSSDLPPACLPGLLLDWLEHLRAPLVPSASSLATAAALNELPLLTLRTLACVFNLAKALMAHVAEDEQIADAIVGRVAMAALQLSAAAAKPVFAHAKQRVLTWECQKPLSPNRTMLAHLASEGDHGTTENRSLTLLLGLPLVPRVHPVSSGDSSCATSREEKATHEDDVPKDDGLQGESRMDERKENNGERPRSASPPRILPALQTPRKQPVAT
ncbi:Aste57867_8782 [Aphanomyces stellatus]|uniref:Aste57867_8782 protein n=1 Tax=Aphanomyces stellatus TaxID=120398 RepID=A0A485KLG7_9STRA|nr:hypothetical protein As57867_008748 [Aphanomyces stellatus]VFT85668.1 Aste57867_8782 [Aphanomyces stellatus]